MPLQKKTPLIKDLKTEMPGSKFRRFTNRCGEFLVVSGVILHMLVSRGSAPDNLRKPSIILTSVGLIALLFAEKLSVVELEDKKRRLYEMRHIIDKQIREQNNVTIYFERERMIAEWESSRKRSSTCEKTADSHQEQLGETGGSKKEREYSEQDATAINSSLTCSCPDYKPNTFDMLIQQYNLLIPPWRGRNLLFEQSTDVSRYPPFELQDVSCSTILKRRASEQLAKGNSA